MLRHVLTGETKTMTEWKEQSLREGWEFNATEFTEENFMYPIETRAEAAAKGRKKYFTGVPCKYNHVNARRYVASGQCEKCMTERAKRYSNSNPDMTVVTLKVHHNHTQALKDYCDMLNKTEG